MNEVSASNQESVRKGVVSKEIPLTDKISPTWHKQYERERAYDRDFKYAEGKKSLPGGIDNPKNWRGGKWEMNHDPRSNRKRIESSESSARKMPVKKESKAVTKNVVTKR